MPALLRFEAVPGESAEAWTEESAVERRTGRGRMALREKSQNKAGRPRPADPARARHQSDGMTLPSNPAGVQQESSMAECS